MGSIGGLLNPVSGEQPSRGAERYTVSAIVCTRLGFASACGVRQRSAVIAFGTCARPAACASPLILLRASRARHSQENGREAGRGWGGGRGGNERDEDKKEKETGDGEVDGEEDARVYDPPDEAPREVFEYSHNSKRQPPRSESAARVFSSRRLGHALEFSWLPAGANGYGNFSFVAVQ